MAKKFRKCKVCGAIIAKNAKFCPQCGAKNKKSIFKKWWFWLFMIILFFVVIGSGNDADNSTTNEKNSATTDSTPISSTASENSITSEIAEIDSRSVTNEAKEPAKTEYHVGDTLEDGNTKIVFMSSGDYTEENDFMQPADGNKYIYLQFAFENISDSSDASISFYNFECFADGYAADMYYGGDEDLSATLSAGRATTGYIYFEIPIDAEVIEIEYETNFFTEEKIKFIFEGNKDSGYIQKLSATPTEGAHIVGDMVESSNLAITYLSCNEYKSDNSFIEPADGYRFVSCEFEFENIGTSDELVSSFDFDCYADGLNCNATYIRDDDLQATLSAGRKTIGTVTFEVPIDAEVVEVEYLSNYWTSNRVVFNAKVSE